MEGFVEEDKEQQKESDTTRPHAILIPFHIGYSDADSRQNQARYFYFPEILLHSKLNNKLGPIVIKSKIQIMMIITNTAIHSKFNSLLFFFHFVNPQIGTIGERTSIILIIHLLTAIGSMLNANKIRANNAHL